MKTVVGVALFVALSSFAAPRADLLPPNAEGVSMGEWFTIVRDVDAAKKFYVLLGGTPTKIDGTDVVKFPGLFVFLRKGEPSGGSVGSVIHHTGFHSPNGADLVAKLIATGVKTDPKAGTRLPVPTGSSWGFVYSPDDLKIEILDSSRTTAAIGISGLPGASPLVGSIATDHVHFYVAESSVAPAQAWYSQMFGAKTFLDPVPRPNQPVLAGSLPGAELKFSKSPDLVVPTKGRALDSIGFEVKDLETFCEKLEANGVKLNQPYSRTRHKSYASAELTDPWGTSIVLTEGMDKF